VRQFRDPFSLETAEGFPVDEVLLSSQFHIRRARDIQEKETLKKKEETERKSPISKEQA